MTVSSTTGRAIYSIKQSVGLVYLPNINTTQTTTSTQGIGSRYIIQWRWFGIQCNMLNIDQPWVDYNHQEIKHDQLKGLVGQALPSHLQAAIRFVGAQRGGSWWWFCLISLESVEIIIYCLRLYMINWDDLNKVRWQARFSWLSVFTRSPKVNESSRKWT